MAGSIPAQTLDQLTTFGDLLRYLRRRAGLTQIELSMAVGYSHQQITRLEKNQRLPDVTVIQARFVEPLGLEHEPAAVARLLDLAAQVRRADAPSLGLCPYKGMEYFDEADAELFVGREALTAKLTAKVLSMTARDEPGQGRFLAVVGASGSGKSSLVRAGLVPALRWEPTSADWQIRVLTPSAHPLTSLTEALSPTGDSLAAIAALMDELAHDPRSVYLLANRALKSQKSSRLVLVIDQFEELFALCRSEDERSAFIGDLLTAAAEPDGPVVVVVTLRADFYAQCAAYPDLREALAAQQEYIGAMSGAELRRAIEEPAAHGHWELEPGLVNQLLHDVGNEPGALPLLSHALLETWQRRRGRTLTLSGYAASGGVRGAIAETAEAVFTDQLGREQQAIARRIFLRLTELGDETAAADTRRRATITELVLKPEERDATRAVLTALADARLITVSEDAAEVAHEALIREWPTLRSWLEDNRESLRLHRQLTEAAQEWSRTERDADLLYRGTRLAQAHEWGEAHESDLNALEKEFLTASLESAQREAAEREGQRQRELEAAQRLADEQSQSAGRLRRRAYLLGGAFALAVLLAGLAAFFGDRANRSAIAAQADFAHADAQRLAAEANNLEQREEDTATNLMALLAIRSLAARYTPSGDVVLTALTGREAPPREFRGHADKLNGVDFSPDGRYLATGSLDKTARIWDLATGETVRTFSQGNGGAGVGHVRFSPDAKYLATTGLEGTTQVWNVITGEQVQTFEGCPSIGTVAFSPDGKYLVTDCGETARIWDVATGKPVHILNGHGDVVPGATYSPDGKYALTFGVDMTHRLWDAATGAQLKVFPLACADAMAFSPDSKTFAAGCDDYEVRMVDIATGDVVGEFIGHQNLIGAARFSPDGRTLLTGADDKTARLWDVASGQTIRVFRGHVAEVKDVAFSRDGSLIATASWDGIARVWDLQAAPIGVEYPGPAGDSWLASFSPDGKRVVTANSDGSARVWDAVTGKLIKTLTGHTGDVLSAVFSPDGKWVLTAGADSIVRLWDAATGQALRDFEGQASFVSRAIFSPDGRLIVSTNFGGDSVVWDAQTGRTISDYSGCAGRPAFSPDGKTLANGCVDGTVRIWDPLTGKDILVLTGHTGDIVGAAFSPDGDYLLTSGGDGTRLWDVQAGKEVRRFPGASGPVAYSPDGKYVLIGDRANWTVSLWDVNTGQELRRFAGHAGGVTSVSFSPDGKYILTSGADGTARMWPVDLDEAISVICANLTRDFTPEEREQYGIPDDSPTCPAGP